MTFTLSGPPRSVPQHVCRDATYGRMLIRLFFILYAALDAIRHPPELG